MKILLQRVSKIGDFPQRLKPRHLRIGSAPFRLAQGTLLRACSFPKLIPAYALLAFLLTCSLFAQERQVDPTWLHRSTSSLQDADASVASGACSYKPIFGQGDRDARSLRTVTRFGELVLGPGARTETSAGGKCQLMAPEREEEIYFVLSGNAVLNVADRPYAMRANDFTYLAPGVRHTFSNQTSAPARVLVMGFRIPQRIAISSAAAEPRIVNMDNVKEENVSGHPNSVLYKLLIGAHTATRDAIDQAYIVTSFFWMDFAPGGTNFPHHHEGAEEIYLVMDGAGDMVAGGGMDGVEGRHPAAAGDAYYFRANCTVGFYNQDKAGAKAHILAVRARIPAPDEDD